MERSKSLADQHHLVLAADSELIILARCYAVILSWPECSDKSLDSSLSMVSLGRDAQHYLTIHDQLEVEDAQ